MTSLHFAFVAFNRNPARFREDPSFIYRCENVAAALEAAGHRTTLLHITELSPLSRFDVVVFHRPRWSWRLGLLLALLRRRSSVLVADFDDLVFNENFARVSPGVLNGLVSLQATQGNYRAASRAMATFDRITVSTEPLACHVREILPQATVEVLPNAVHLAWRRAAGEKRQPSAPVITYFPGTRSHDRDFAAVAGALQRFLHKHPRASLRVTGHLTFDLHARPGQVVHREKVSFEDYPGHFQDGWVNLAPLEATPFNRCKSALKVLEAGFWNLPTVCSPNPDAARFAGAGAVEAEGENGWHEQLESLLDPARYEALTRGLREKVVKVARVEDSAARLLDLVRDRGA